MKTPKEAPASWSDMHSREKRRYRRVFFVISLVAVYVFSVAVVWAVVYSPLFRVKTVEITGNRNVSSQTIVDLVDSEIFDGSAFNRLLGGRNLLSWPKNLSQKTLEFIPELNSVSIEKNYVKRSVKITVREKRPFGSWCLTESSATQEAPIQECFWFDEQGNIFKRAIGMEGSIFTVVDDYSQKNLGIGSKILPDKFIANIFSIFKAIADSGLRVKEMRLDDLSLEEMEVDTYDGPKIYFSLRFPADSVPDAIVSLKGKTIFGDLQYVDFRVENRVYYK